MKINCLTFYAQILNYLVDSLLLEDCDTNDRNKFYKDIHYVSMMNFSIVRWTMFIEGLHPRINNGVY